VGQGKRFSEPFTAPANKVCVHKQLQRLPQPAALNQYNDASIAALLVAQLTTLPAECASDPCPGAAHTASAQDGLRKRWSDYNHSTAGRQGPRQMMPSLVSNILVPLLTFNTHTQTQHRLSQAWASQAGTAALQPQLQVPSKCWQQARP
jgi:hypothetical protein